MEKSSKKENTHNFSQSEEHEVEQIKFHFQEKPEEDFIEHEVLQDFLVSEELAEKEKTFIEELEEPLEQLSFEDFVKHPEDIIKEPILDIQTQAPLDTPMYSEPEQKSSADLLAEMNEENTLLQKFQEEGEHTIVEESDGEETTLQNQTLSSIIASDSDTYSLKKGTQRAFFVLKDMFGDIETEEDKLAMEEYEISPRKKLGALFLSISLGFIGAHRLYLGHYKKIPVYFATILFWWLSREFLPDLGLSNLLATIMIFWILADILAIIFSRKIRDGRNRVLQRWL